LPCDKDVLRKTKEILEVCPRPKRSLKCAQTKNGPKKCPKEVLVMLPHNFLKKKVRKQSPELSLPEKKVKKKFENSPPVRSTLKRKVKKVPKH
jgi:hypothetical protein